MTVKPLKHPLTIQAIVDAFPDLEIDPSLVRIRKRTIQEAIVDGVWSQSALHRVFTRAGFKLIGTKADMAYVNADGTIGLVCYGVDVHKTENRFTTFNFEIQARSKRQAAEGVVPAMIF